MRRLLALAALLFLAAAPARAFGPDNGPWPMMNGSDHRVSTSTLSGPKAPKVSWSHVTTGAANPRNYMGVVVGSDGTIYVGGRSILEALNPNGTTKWTASEQPASSSWGTPFIGDNGRIYVSTPTMMYAYSTAGSGSVTFFSSASAMGAGGTNPGGGGSVNIQGSLLYLSHGDETFRPTLDTSHFNTYGYDAALVPTVPVQKNANSVLGRSGLTAGTGGLYYQTNDTRLYGPVGGGDAFFGPALPSESLASNVNEPGLSMRSDDTFLTVISNYNSECAAQPGGAMILANLKVPAPGPSVLWRKCDIQFQAQDHFYVPVSSDPSSTFVYASYNKTLYSIGNSTGGTQWQYSPASFGYQPSVDSTHELIGQPTLLGGATLYFTYCPTSPANTTRLVALDANTGARFWDVAISTSYCYLGQPVPAGPGRIVVYNGPEVIQLEDSGAASMTLSTSAAAVSSNLWFSTVTVQVKTAAGAAVSSGVPVELTRFASTIAGSVSPSATSYALTDTSGQSKLVVALNLSGVTPAQYASVGASVTVRSPGIPTQTFFARESRAASVTIATGTAVMEANNIRVSTLTFTVKDGSGSPVSGVPCTFTTSGGSNPQPNTPSAAFFTTNGSGQASVVVRDEMYSLAYAGYPTYALTHTAACLGSGAQTVTMNEARVASVSVSSGVPIMEGTVRVSTLTVTVKNSLGAPVPDVVLDLEAQSGSMSVSWLGAANQPFTDAAGQAKFRVEEYLDLLGPSTFAARVSTLTVHTLDFPDQDFYLKEERVTTVSVSSTPAYAQGNYRVFQVTVTATGVGGAPVPDVPISLSNLNLGFLSQVTTKNGANTFSGFVGTNAQGVSTFTITQDIFGFFAEPANNASMSYFAVFDASYTVGMPGRAQFTLDSRETRAASYTVGVSSTILRADLRFATMTVTVLNSLSQPVPGVAVAVTTFTRAMAGASSRLDIAPAFGGTGNYGGAFTDAAGRATFTLFLDPINTYDDFNDFFASVTVVPLNLSYSTSVFKVETNKLDHYSVTVPTYSPVGQLFVSTITAKNVYDHTLSSYTESGINLVPLFATTNVQGTGTLGTSITGAFTNGQFVISSQTYNKVEQIDIRASRSSDGRSGRSSTIDVTGPDHFTISIPTGTQAGVPFSMTVTAVAANGQQVFGYAATLSLSAVQASNTSLAGAGILGVTNVNLPANGTLTINNQTYTKAEGIIIRAVDTGASVSGYSSSTTVRAGPAASLSINANPQSTVAGVPSVLTSTVLDQYSNPVSGSTVTFALVTGSGTVALSITSLPSAVTSTNAVANAAGVAQAFFASTNTLSSQADVLRASVGSLLADTTIYNAVLIGPAGGTIVNFGDPRTKAVVPANAYGVNVRLSAQVGAEIPAAELALATAAMAASPNTFISSYTAKFVAVRDSNPNASAGAASQLVSIELPFNADVSSNVTVGGLRAQSLLVPLSVLRVFKLNSATSVFEMVLDGTNLPSASARSVTAQVSDPNGIYALGAPPYVTVGPTSSGTVTTSLASGATVTVTVPAGAFTTAASLSVSLPSAGSVPAIPATGGVTGTGVTVSITAGGLQPARDVTVEVGYVASDITGLRAENLRLMRYDASTGWVLLNSRVDTVARKVTGTTNHFSLFQIVAVNPQADVSQGYAFPNPFRPSQGHTTIGFANLSSGAHVKIYSTTGRLLKELDADTTGRITTWDGSDSNGRPLASGVYVAVFSQGRDRKTFKFAVQR